jgi:hypothetical protein
MTIDSLVNVAPMEVENISVAGRFVIRGWAGVHDLNENVKIWCCKISDRR